MIFICKQLKRPAAFSVVQLEAKPRNQQKHSSTPAETTCPPVAAPLAKAQTKVSATGRQKSLQQLFDCNRDSNTATMPLDSGAMF